MTPEPSCLAVSAVRVLLATDDPFTQTIVQAILRQVGYAVDAAGDAASARAALACRTYAVLIVDMGLSEDGAAHLLAQLDNGPKIRADLPLILINDDQTDAKPPSVPVYARLYAPLDQDLLRVQLARCVAQPAPVPVDVNTAVLRQLQADLPPGLLSTMMPVLIREIEQYCRQIEAALAAHDAEQLRCQAHALKSNAAAYGLERLTRLALEFENAARYGQLAAAQARQAELRPLVKTALTALLAYIG